jgi:hypothetical protein
VKTVRPRAAIVKPKNAVRFIENRARDITEARAFTFLVPITTIL